MSIGSHMRSIAWWHFQWPWWTTFNDLQCTLTRIWRSQHFLKSNIGKTAHLKDKVTVAQEEKYLTYGMVLFGDLDW